MRVSRPPRTLVFTTQFDLTSCEGWGRIRGMIGKGGVFALEVFVAEKNDFSSPLARELLEIVCDRRRDIYILISATSDRSPR